ncbi:uncharacterized protein LOC129755475 [Uranotaenia lowii]|uniref:uncharacterized protein LOC129755475 n=1 Tax=Uranotaenia lowii TaxID=190385 RepID=UPI002478B747|nr:uncharacterized protein LOC129755475 [Uranotaenia lowii]
MDIAYFNKMAASVYATPPPDFSGEEAALSDTSNSSQTNSSNNSTMKASKRPLSSTFLHSPQGMSTATQLSSDSLPDLSKKRRKQSMPSRISGNGDPETEGAEQAPVTENQEAEEDIEDADSDVIQSMASVLAEQQSNFQKIFLSNLSQLQKQHLLQQQEINRSEEASTENVSQNGSGAVISLKSPESLLSLPAALKDLTESIAEKRSVPNGMHASEDVRENNRETNIDRNENELNNVNHEKAVSSEAANKENNDKLMNGNKQQSASPAEPMDINLKKELLQDPEWDGEIHRTPFANSGKPEDWLSFPGLPFPFPSDAAAALTASGYLPQLPLLGMPSVPSFGPSDNSNRPNVPPLRIFNPEAYCDLCNKEFCNKYFLKTHKANKHGIYEPQSGGNDSLQNMGSLNPFHQLSQVFQMQQQQQQQGVLQEQQEKSNQENQIQNNELPSQSLMRPITSPKMSVNPVQPTVFCDICFKKFSSLSAMRKHRSKAHEVNNYNHHNTQQQQHAFSQQFHNQQQQFQQALEQKPEPISPSELSPALGPFRMPEGFREDYSVEQEDASFTPQPRKLSPLSIQAAREANFSADKLKRLGVLNPDAFCEICCKEYCNKYFLRTHKLKRHGIFLPPDDTAKEERNPWNFSQTSPLNLIVGGSEGPGFPPPLKKLVEECADLAKGNLKEEPQRNENANGSADAGQDDEAVEKSDQASGAEQEAEAISVDLQKLQSMIMQLNDLNNQRKMTCGICGKEMENQYLLHAHMIQEHNNMNENNNGIKSPNIPAHMQVSGNEYEVCKQCDKEFSNTFMLKQHLMEAHGIQSLSPKREGFITPERPTTAPSMSMPTGPNYGERKPTFSMTPTSSYCEICNKELCNKYFMKTHMQRMHGIEIENGAQIGGVVCNICNKELCSKYFLRVHKHNTHGIVEEGAPLPQPRNNGSMESMENAEFPFSLEGILKPGEISDLSNRYYSHFTEVCPLCSRRFRSAKWLRAHLLSDHGKMGVDKLREIEHRLGGSSKSSSPSLKIPNGGFGLNLSDQKFNPKSPFGLPSPDNKFMLKNPFSGLFGVDPANSNVGPKGYQCSYCPFSTPLLPLLFIHERTHTSLNIVQQQMMQEKEKNQPSMTLSPVIKSESAVSLAKEASRFSLPIPSSSSDTPSLTPASTPLPSSSQEAETPKAPASPHPPQVASPQEPCQPESSQPQIEEQESRKSASPKSEQNPILAEMANLTQRPAIYALPQQSGPLLMQSFLIEESAVPEANRGDDQLNPAQPSASANRFVPAVVFLPVKERIHSPMTISFTLSPA